MASVQTGPSSIKTLADLLDRLGGVPTDRIRFHPFPGTATVQDVIDVHEREERICELVAGVLLEKVTGFAESSFTGFLGTLLNGFVIPRNLGIVTGPAGAVELMPDLVRIPDLAFTSWDRMPDHRCPTAPIPRLVPNLGVEVLESQKHSRRDGGQASGLLRGRRAGRLGDRSPGPNRCGVHVGDAGNHAGGHRHARWSDGAAGLLAAVAGVVRGARSARMSELAKRR